MSKTTESKQKIHTIQIHKYMNSQNLKSTFFKTTAIVLSIIASAFSAKGQATTVVNSTTGYSVSITLDVIRVIAPSGCPNGYNYNTRISYDISFSGTNIPSSLYTLQTSLNCGGQGNFVSLPTNGGNGQRNTGSNPWRNTTDCQTATPESLNCSTFNLVIHGPGISSRTITMNRAVALPVNMISFTAENKNSKVLLNWETASEINNSHFVVERSIDGNNWVALSEVAAAKEVSSINAYSFTDNKAVEGLSFYRLTQVDLNGKATTIDRIATVKHVETVKLSVYPNPATTEFSIEGEEISNAEITVLDAMGKVVTIQTQVEGNKITFSTEGLNNGMYFINVLLNEEVKTLKVTVSK